MSSDINKAPSDPKRRSFFASLAAVFMASGLMASYGTFAAFLGKFLYPAKPRKKSWLFLTELKKMKLGDSLSYESPAGEKVAIARQGESGAANDFIALSSVCPHLGCQVHWEGNKNRFFCPCHNGVFDPQGKATEGPPADAKQNLPKYPLKVENGLLFIEVPTEKLGDKRGRIRAPEGPKRHARPSAYLGKGM